MLPVSQWSYSMGSAHPPPWTVHIAFWVNPGKSDCKAQWQWPHLCKQVSYWRQKAHPYLKGSLRTFKVKGWLPRADSHTQYFSAAGSKQTKYGSNGLAILETEHTSLMRSLLEIKVEGVLRRTVFNNKILNDKHRLLKIRRAILRKAF